MKQRKILKNSKGISTRHNPSVSSKTATAGITLIALVITIIVLLILAAVSIVTLTGENGILTQAGNAKEENERSQAEEEVKLALGNLQIEESQSAISQDDKREILEEDLKQFYPKQQPESTVEIEGAGFLINHRGYQFEVDENYNVLFIEPFDAEEWDKTAASVDCFYWKSEDPNAEGYGTVIGYTEKIENYTVLRFPSRCTEITFSNNLDYDGVTTTTSRAFTNNILEVEIPGTVTSIGSYAFGHPENNQSFTSLEKVVIEYGIESIGNATFQNCASLTSVEIPNSVTSIGGCAFDGCTSLSNITIPSGITSIGSSAFSRCTSLSNITIPSSVTSIGYAAFDNTAWYDNQSDGVVYVGKVLYKYKGTMQNNTNIQIKDGTTEIMMNAFYGCTGLSNITIPSSMERIGQWAFYGCTSLNSITIPKSVSNIGGQVFYKWTSSQTINIQGYTSEPSGWSTNWNGGCSATINWGQ